MRNVRISVVCLLWLGVLLLGVQTASGQEDSTRVRRDSLRVGAGTLQLPVKSGISGVGVEEYRLEPSLEAGREVPVFRPVRRDPDLRLPYQENPSLRFDRADLWYGQPDEPARHRAAQRGRLQL